MAAFEIEAQLVRMSFESFIGRLNEHRLISTGVDRRDL